MRFQKDMRMLFQKDMLLRFQEGQAVAMQPLCSEFLASMCCLEVWQLLRKVVLQALQLALYLLLHGVW